MPREKEAYRDNLERICDFFPREKYGDLLNISQVVEFTGLCPRAVVKRYPFKQNYISKATLARELS